MQPVLGDFMNASYKVQNRSVSGRRLNLTSNTGVYGCQKFWLLLVLIVATACTAGSGGGAAAPAGKPVITVTAAQTAAGGGATDPSTQTTTAQSSGTSGAAAAAPTSAANTSAASGTSVSIAAIKGGNVLYLTSPSALPSCDAGHANQLYYVASSQQFQACDGANWAVVNISGAPGSTGAQGSVGAQGSTGAQGATGPQGSSGVSLNTPTASIYTGFAGYTTDNTFPKGMYLTLNGAYSIVPSGNTPTCSWGVVTQPSGSNLNASAATGCKFPVTLNIPGAYTFSLVASDGSLSSLTAKLTLNVVNSVTVGTTLNSLTLTGPAIVGTAVQLYLLPTLIDSTSSTGYSADPGVKLTCTPSVLSLPQMGTPPTFATPGLYASTYWGDMVTFNSPGLHRLQVTCTDGTNFTTAAPMVATYNVTVVGPANSAAAPAGTATMPPALVPGTTQVGSRGVKNFFNCVANDPSGEADTYSWSLSSKPAGSTSALNSSAAAANFIPDLQGTYTAQCSASNSSGSASTTFTLTVDSNWQGILVADPGLAPATLPNMAAGPDAQMKVDSSGNLHVAYFGATGALPRYAQKNSAGIIFENIESSGSGGWYPSLTLNASNQPVISYYSATTGKIKVATRTGANTWSIQVLARSLTNPVASAVTIDGSGNLNVFYYDESVPGFFVSVQSSGSWTETRLDSSSSDVGTNPVAIYSSAKNTLLVTYFDSSNRALRYGAKVGAGAWNFGNVTTTGGAGYYSSLALKSDGTPAVAFAYQNSTNLGYATFSSGSWAVTAAISSNAVASVNRPQLVLGVANPSIICGGWNASYLSEAYYNGTVWSWTSASASTSYSAMAQISATADSSGNFYALGYNTTNQIFSLITKVNGAWQSPVPFSNLVSGTNVVAPTQFLTTSTTPNGTLQLVATNDQSGAYNGIIHSYRTSAGSWSTELVKSVTSTGNYAAGLPLSSNLMRALTFAPTPGTLQWADSNPGAWGAFSSSASVPTVPAYINSAIDSASNTHVCYHNGSTALLYVMYNGTSWTTPESIASVPVLDQPCVIATSGTNIYMAYSDPIRQTISRVVGAANTFDIKDITATAATNMAIAASGSAIHFAYLSQVAPGSYSVSWLRLDNLTQASEVALSNCQNLSISLTVNSISGQPVASCVQTINGSQVISVSTRGGGNSWTTETATTAVPQSGQALHRLYYYNSHSSLIMTNMNGNLVELRGN